MKFLFEWWRCKECKVKKLSDRQPVCPICHVPMQVDVTIEPPSAL